MKLNNMTSLYLRTYNEPEFVKSFILAQWPMLHQNHGNYVVNN